MKKLTIFSITILLCFSSHFQTTKAEQKSSYSTKSSYDLYKQRVNDVCNYYKTKNTVIDIEDNYPQIVKNSLGNKNKNTVSHFTLDMAKEVHRENMNNIYKCALLNSQKKAIELTKNKLKNTVISKQIGAKLNTQLNKVKLSMTTLKCRNAKNTGSLQKNEVLKQTTYQTCKYVSYLEYLKEQSEKLSYYLKDLDNYNKDKAREELSKNYSPEKIDNMIDDYYDKKVEIKQANVYDSFRSKEFQKRMIQEEIDHTYNIFPLAFHAYSEYENSIVIHFLLETIKQDYIAVRDRLHKVINPINQVVYKVSNAMKK